MVEQRKPVQRKLRRRTGWIIAGVLLFATLISWGWLQLVGWPPLPGRSSYKVVPNWPRLPAGVILGQVPGIAVDSLGHIYLFARGKKVWATEAIDPAVIAAPTVYVIDPRSGELLDSWGEERFVMPHGLTIDHQDRVWLTDVGLHQVFRFSADGRLQLTLGEAGMPGSDAVHFNRPTDVAVRRDGSFYISDGYENSRIIRYDASGRYLLEWGGAGAGPGQFNVPHSLAVDESGRLFVADRGNARIQIFDEKGVWLQTWQSRWLVGRPWAVRMDGSGHVIVVDGGDQNAWLPDRARVLTLTMQGDIVNRFGGYGSRPGQFIWPHAVAIGSDGTMYVAEAGSGQRVQKFESDFQAQR